VLDIGCGSGDFLRIASEMGWRTAGIDPDPQAAVLKSNLNVVRAGLPDTNLPSEAYDVVTLSHVIEHVHDPLACLREVFRLCKQGAQVWIATPNLDSYGHRKFQSAWIGLHPPNHLVLFTRDSLKRALHEAGFRRVRYENMHPQEDYFNQSWALAAGRKPFDLPMDPLPLSHRACGALTAVKAIFLPRRREEIVAIAVKL
jgi:SAM-dependent methyltransferase